MRSERQIEVVSDTFAWNEIGEAGGGLDPTVGSAVPARNTVDDRLLRMWMTPFGAIKAARVAKDPKVTVENGVVVITFTLTGPAHPGPSTKVVVGGLTGTPVRMTLDPENRPAKVEVRRGATTLETTYSDYADLNPPNYKADIFFPREDHPQGRRAGRARSDDQGDQHLQPLRDSASPRKCSEGAELRQQPGM